MAGGKRVLKILAFRSERSEKSWGSGHPDRVGRRPFRVCRGHQRSIPQNRGSALYYPSDPLFYPLCFLQGRVKQFTAGLKPVYKAPTEEAALTALDEFEAQWGKKYPLAVKSWRVNWNELATMNIVDKWTMPIWDWDLILNNLMIYF